ncbi:phosphoribosyl-ATP pyrophosphohydrolase [Niallia oryzisoli]|uniref:phosphoribosyl-ATP pyrophosphohydrolase n=1 Tax=Niallia oryzisoli TaxID=1737571 RepID=UPI003735972F
MQIHNKLVRDRIPEIIEKSGKMYRSRVLDDEEFITELRKKAFEELQEYMTTSSNDEAAEELADILEVIHALADYHGLTIGAVEQVRKRKYEIRGGFKERVFLMEIEE